VRALAWSDARAQVTLTRLFCPSLLPFPCSRAPQIQGMYFEGRLDKAVVNFTPFEAKVAERSWDPKGAKIKLRNYDCDLKPVLESMAWKLLSAYVSTLPPDPDITIAPKAPAKPSLLAVSDLEPFSASSSGLKSSFKRSATSSVMDYPPVFARVQESDADSAANKSRRPKLAPELARREPVAAPAAPSSSLPFSMSAIAAAAPARGTGPNLPSWVLPAFGGGADAGRSASSSAAAPTGLSATELATASPRARPAVFWDGQRILPGLSGVNEAAAATAPSAQGQPHQGLTMLSESGCIEEAAAASAPDQTVTMFLHLIQAMCSRVASDSATLARVKEAFSAMVQTCTDENEAGAHRLMSLLMPSSQPATAHARPPARSAAVMRGGTSMAGSHAGLPVASSSPPDASAVSMRNNFYSGPGAHDFIEPNVGNLSLSLLGESTAGAPIERGREARLSSGPGRDVRPSSGPGETCTSADPLFIR
jgi:hypothetical protein